MQEFSTRAEPQHTTVLRAQASAALATAALTCGLVAANAVPAPAQELRGDAQAGQIVFNNACRTCHTLKRGDNRLGPNLYALLGRKAGAVEDYPYSSALKGADLIWDRSTLDQFIAAPDSAVRGNNMKPYTGMTAAADRANLIAYLESVN